MANYTGLSDLKNNPHRSGFDLSKKVLFTAKSGELLPVYWDIAIPGDKYSLKPEYFTRTQPVESSAYTRVREYFDVYEVPLSLLWKSAPAALTQMGEKNPEQATGMGKNLIVNTGLPSLPLSDLSDALFRVNGGVDDINPANDEWTPYSVNNFGFSRGSCAAKLFMYLGYGSFQNSKGGDLTEGKFWGTTLSQSSTVNSASVYWPYYSQDIFVNALPLLAYNKIYQDFFRWEQWENADPSTYNVDYYDGTPGQPFYGTLPDANDDYWKSPTMFDLRYANFKKDLFMGVLPETQFGDVSMVLTTGGTGDLAATIGIPIPAGNISSKVGFSRAGFEYQINSLQIGDSIPTLEDSFGVASKTSTAPSPGDSLLAINEKANLNATIEEVSKLQTQFSILALRQATAVQKWKEISQSGDYDYRAQIYKHFGVKVPAVLSNLAIWRGGMSRNLDISEVVNQNLDSAESSATIYGKGVGSGNGSFNFEVSQHSVIMVIYHNEPVLDYALSGPDGQLWATDATDIPIPEFDNIGMESVSMLQFNNSSLMDFFVVDFSTSDLFMGYQPRYYNWKTKLDTVLGAFQTTLPQWVTSFNNYTLFRYFGAAGFRKFDPSDPFPTGSASFDQLFNYNFFKINPRILDSIFGVACDSTWDTDQFLVNAYFDVKVVRNLSRDGLPY